jgi:hypothetical protein
MTQIQGGATRGLGFLILRTVGQRGIVKMVQPNQLNSLSSHSKSTLATVRSWFSLSRIGKSPAKNLQKNLCRCRFAALRLLAAGPRAP